jgi:phenylacetate-CoA ligase
MMLIHSQHRLYVLEEAIAEIRAQGAGPPPPGFYTRKLQSAWERARNTPVHADFGEFTSAAFEALPVTSKDELKAAPWDHAAVGPGRAAKYYETTGTSGRVTPTPRLAADTIWNTIAVAEAWRSVLAGEDRVLIMLPSDIVPVADLVTGVCEYLDLPHVRAYPFTTGICDWDRLLGMWKAFRPTVIFAAPGVALQWTRLLRQREIIDDAASTVRTQMLLGEVNTGPLRRRLAAWWQCSVYDASYGSTETGTLAATCAAGRQHLLTTTNYFELATAGGISPLPGSGDGRLVVTPLNLYARPLLRLDTGDEVTVGGECACGSRKPACGPAITALPRGGH